MLIDVFVAILIDVFVAMLIDVLVAMLIDVFVAMVIDVLVALRSLLDFRAVFLIVLFNGACLFLLPLLVSLVHLLAVFPALYAKAD